jgi:L-fucose mutarotase
MLRGKLLHPEILDALGRAGHGTKVLVADGNYPFETGAHPRARRVFLNLCPGVVSVPDVLRVLVDAIPIEAASVMMPPDAEPPIFSDFRRMLPANMPLDPLERFAFYTAARGDDVGLVIATGEERTYANILLTIGVV